MNELRSLLLIIEKKERAKSYLIFFIMIIAAILDIVGIAMILPYITIITTPDNINQYKIFGLEYNNLPVQIKENFQIILGFLLIFFIIISLTFRAYATYVQSRFSLLQEYKIGERLLRIYLSQPYIWIVEKNTSELTKNILSEVSVVVNQGLMPAMNLFAQLIAASGIIILLLFLNWKIAIGSVLLFLLAYTLIVLVVKNKLNKVGKERQQANSERYRSLNQTLGAIKEIKVAGKEEAYLAKFGNWSKKYSEKQASAYSIAQLPRYAIEGTAFGGMILIILYLLLDSRSHIESVIPILSVFGYAAFKILPSIQQIYSGYSQLKFVMPAISQISNELKIPLSKYLEENRNQILNFNSNILLKNITFKYPDSKGNALENITLEIKSRAIVGITGGSGSGKTTLINILLGLFTPTNGSIIVDGQKISPNNLRAWQDKISYVSQNIYISDASIKANIAFGCKKEEIDETKLRRAAKIAKLDFFIENELKDGYDTIVGENGAKLSGGQRQRIGVARALYTDSQLLILDEATSALDNITEAEIMKELYQLKDTLTIIIIAHRLNILKGCDIIYIFDGGKLKTYGNHENLKLTEALFAKG